MAKETVKTSQTSEQSTEKVPKEVFCSFCNKNSKFANRLIAGPNGIFICEECVSVCTRILFEENSTAAIARQQRPEALAEFLGTKTEFPPLDCLRRVHTQEPALRGSLWGVIKGVDPETDTLPKQPYPVRSAAGLVDFSKIKNQQPRPKGRGM